MTSSELLTVWYTLLSQKSLNSDRELLSGQNQSQIRQSAPFFIESKYKCITLDENWKIARTTNLWLSLAAICFRDRRFRACIHSYESSIFSNGKSWGVHFESLFRKRNSSCYFFKHLRNKSVRTVSQPKTQSRRWQVRRGESIKRISTC